MRLASLVTVGSLAVAVACGDNGTGVSGDVVVGPGNSFSPKNLNLTSGRNVTWAWAGGPHNILFEDGAPGADNRSAGTFSRDFTAAATGTYRYRCTLHSTNFTTGMVGTVVVP